MLRELQVPAGIEALHGLASNDNVTVLPEPIDMAASFDDELVYRIFSAVSDETRAKYKGAIRNGEGNRRFLSLSVWMPNPLFPFGYGLSYTSFSIGNAKFSKTGIKNNESLEIIIPVANTGKRNGTKIVQVYVRKVNDADGPIKTLKGFQRIEVAAGKTCQALISLPYTSFEFYNRESRRMAVTPGDYEILYGNSSDANDLKTTKIVIQ